MPQYLLDTSCFYAVTKSASKQETLRSLIPKVATSPLAVFEIGRIKDNARDFALRKQAMRALHNVDPMIIDELPDEIVKRAFGRPSKMANGAHLWTIVRIVSLASSYEDVMRGVQDPQLQASLHFDPRPLHAWKNEMSRFFTDSVVKGSLESKSILADDLRRRFPQLNEEARKRLGKEIRKAAARDDTMVRLHTLVGLSVRAGLLSKEQLGEVAKSGATGKMEELWRTAEAHYTGLLDSHIKAYLGFQRRHSEARTPERNALFDLEFLLHLDAHSVPYTFVTTEKMWIEIGADTIPGRIVGLDTLL